MSGSFFLSTLGCKVNQYESQAVREAWTSLGTPEATHPKHASWILVHSCAITAKAVADVRSTVRRLHKASPGAAIVIAGCAAEVVREELQALPGVVRVLGQSEKERLLQGPAALRVDPAEDAAAQPLTADPAYAGKGAAYPQFMVSGYDRSRAVLKIQDGCSHGCAYCIVPIARGPARSRPFDDALAEAKRLLEAGFREIVISGINLRQYSDPSVLPGTPGVAGMSVLSAGALDRSPGASSGRDFWAFLQRLDAALAPKWRGIARLRLSSLEPGQLGKPALDALAACSLVAPHLHLSLQSGSPGVLQRMNRGHYTPDTLPAFFEDLKKIWPVFGLGADILTAFPGETDQEFAETVACCRDLPFSYAHVFPYSQRPGTAAAGMTGQITAEVKKTRAAYLRQLLAQKKEAFLHTLLSLPAMQVVFEDRKENPAGSGIPLLRGVNEFYAECRGDASLESMAVRSLIRVKPITIEDGALRVGTMDEALV